MRNSEFPDGTCVVKITNNAHELLSQYLSKDETSEPEKVIAHKLTDPESH